MRALSLVIVAFACAVLAAALFRGGGRTGDAAAPEPASILHVTGPGNTLASLAARFGRPGVLSYDAKTRTAISSVGLIIEGELILGREDDPSSGETLELDTEFCGDLRLEVRRGGVLRLFHSSIRTVSQILSSGACSRGYAMFVDGELVMKDSRISYISGSTSECLRGPATATILRSVFSYCDGSALSCVEVDGARIRIEGCDFRGSGNWAVVVRGRGGESLEIRDSLLDARVGGLFVSGRSASVRLVDCVFDPAKVIFGQDSGEVAIAWTRRVRVVNSGQSPIAGAMVRAQADNGATGAAPIEALTDAGGLAELVLIERIARPGPSGSGGQPISYTVRAEGPSRGSRAEQTGITARGKDREPLMLTIR